MTDEYLTGPKGTYRLLQRIGSGGMGVVHLALDEDGRTIAVKELHPGLIDDDMLRRLEREVTSMHRVSSPYVAEIRDADVRGSRPFVATRYVQGRALDRTIRERGPLDGPRLVHVARHLATALQAIHDAGIIHRDLKPSNVMLSEGDPVIIDFGIAQAIDATRLTHTGVVVGTPGYVAPEIVNGGVAEHPADIFAWAATVAYAATGRSPFGTGPAEVVFFRIAGGQSDLHGVPEPLLPVLRAALARDPGARPTAGELAERLSTLHLDPPTGENAAVAGAAGAGAATGTAPDAADPGAAPGPPDAGTPEEGANGAAASAAPATGKPDEAETPGVAAEETGDLPASPTTGQTDDLATESVQGGPPPDRRDSASAAWSPTAPAEAGHPPQPPTSQAPGGPAAQWGAARGQAGAEAVSPPHQAGTAHLPAAAPQPAPATGTPAHPGQGQPAQPQSGQAQPAQAQPGQGRFGQGQPGHAQPGHGQPDQGPSSRAYPSQDQVGHGQAGQGYPSQPQPAYGRPGQDRPGAGQFGQAHPAQDRRGPGAPSGHPGQPQPGYGAQPVPTVYGGPQTTPTQQAGNEGPAPKLGIGLAALAVAGVTALAYVIPVFGFVIAVAGLLALGLRDRIRPYGTQTAGAALTAAVWRVAAAFAGAGAIAWLIEAGLELVAKPKVTTGQWLTLRDAPTSTILAVFVALTVLLACAVPRWRAPSRALAALVTGGGGAAPLLRYGLIAISVLAIIAALFAPAPAWLPLPLDSSVGFGEALR